MDVHNPSYQDWEVFGPLVAFGVEEKCCFPTCGSIFEAHGLKRCMVLLLKSCIVQAHGLFISISSILILANCWPRLGSSRYNWPDILSHEKDPCPVGLSLGGSAPGSIWTLAAVTGSTLIDGVPRSTGHYGVHFFSAYNYNWRVLTRSRALEEPKWRSTVSPV